MAIFTLYKKVNAEREKLGIFSYPVKYAFLPSVYLSIGGKKEGSIDKLRLEQQLGVASYYDWSESGIACLEGVNPFLQSYRMILMRNDQLVFSCTIIGAKFTDEVKAVFKTLKNNDKLFLVDVKVTAQSGERVYTKPFELEITVGE